MIRPRNRMYSIPPQSCPQTISPAPSLFPRPRLLPPSVPSPHGLGSHSTIPLPWPAPSRKPECSFSPGPETSGSSTTEEEWKKSEDSCLADIWRDEVMPLLVFDEDRDEYFPAWEDYSLSEDGGRERKFRYGWSWEGEGRSRDFELKRLGHYRLQS
ncbi:hypothetical protein I350_08103 [Cryptococcus amylolentus CBS 6273]|uniref:Uncharacterized protein n=1 Tax=Cryptococcus amylolentus CBS 6273 TaxID=1296118 RepID=A0A1E3J8D0_9TREE|nr:hypothetical protein I350_08103 [Cryptococcus amylolentus CBS 6273]